MIQIPRWLDLNALGRGGFALPSVYLTAVAVWWSIAFLFLLIGLGFSASDEGLQSMDWVLAGGIFTGLVAGVGMMLTGEFRRMPRLVVIGMRVSAGSILFAGFLATALMMWAVFRTSDVLEMIFVLVMALFAAGLFFLPCCAPILIAERRLYARAIAGNPRWHPYQATRWQRSEGLLYFLASVSAAIGFGLAVHRGFFGMSEFSGDNVRQVVASGFVGAGFGYGIGFLMASVIRGVAERTDLSRSLPLLLGAIILPSIAGAAFGILHSLIAACVVVLIAGKIVQRVYALPELGGCPSCGYDLADSHGTICPECGRERQAEKPIHRVSATDRPPNISSTSAIDAEHPDSNHAE